MRHKSVTLKELIKHYWFYCTNKFTRCWYKDHIKLLEKLKNQGHILDYDVWIQSNNNVYQHTWMAGRINKITITGEVTIDDDDDD